MSEKSKNIAWYSRGGHLDLFCRLNAKLSEENEIVGSFFVCHTSEEEQKIKDNYSQDPRNLGKYLHYKRKGFKIDEKRIEELAEEYNFIPLKRLLWSEISERNPSEETLIFNLVTHFEFWEDFLKNNNISSVFTEGPSILSTCVLWAVCNKLEIECISFGNWCIDGRLIFSKKWGCDIVGYEDTYNNLKLDQSSTDYKFSLDYLKKMQETPEKPKYTSINLVTGKKGRPTSSPFPKTPSLKKIISLKSKLQENRTNYYLNKSQRLRSYSSWFLKLSRITIHKFFSSYLERGLDLDKERYFMFPLHTLNEWQNYSQMGMKYPNVLNLIEEISSCIPLGYKLYVKEHPSFFPQKDNSFYKAIKKIRNVRLIHPDEDNFKLVKKSEGVITTASTMGWEAYLLGKLVFMLVDHWSQILPGVYKIKNPEELVKSLQNHKKLRVSNEQEKLEAVYALHQVSFKGALYPISRNMSEENINNLYNPVKAIIN